MLIVAEDETGRRLTEFDLVHGADPYEQLQHRGLRVERPIAATGTRDDLVIRLLASVNGSRPAGSGRPEPSGLPERRRVAAYAWVESSRGVLACEFYRDVPGGRWGLPGGGIDEDEEPVAAVHREVHEETSQRIELGELVCVNTSRHVGPNLNGRVDDFQAVRLIYRATCSEPTDPVVLDVGGTTTAAAWFPADRWQQEPWTPHWRELLVDLFD